MKHSVPEDMMKLIKANEKVLWTGKPEFKPFTLRSIASTFIPLISLIWFASFFIYFHIPLIIPTILFIIFFFGILIFAIFSSSLYPLLLWRNLYYAITDRRVIVRKGVIGIDYDVLNLDYIQQINVDRGVWDKIYDTGTLVIRAVGVTPVRFLSIKRPFKVYEILNTAVRKYVEDKRKL